MGKLIDKALIQAEIMSEENIDRLFKNMNTQNSRFSESFLELARYEPLAKHVYHMMNNGVDPYSILEEVTKQFVEVKNQNMDILMKRNEFAPPPPMEVPYHSLPKDMQQKIKINKDFEKSVLFKVYKFFKK